MIGLKIISYKVFRKCYRKGLQLFFRRNQICILLFKTEMKVIYKGELRKVNTINYKHV